MLRLMVYDRTCSFLSRAWSTGSVLYRALGRLDGCHGVASWSEALRWIAAHDAPIAQLQYWGHGRWGRVFVDRDVLDGRVFSRAHPLHGEMSAVRERLTPDALVWLRTCEAFGANAGHDFAERLANGLGVKVAGHTFIIGALQSGLRTLVPGKRPTWSAEEGIATGSADAPKEAEHSLPHRPRTISCLANDFPAAWFDEDAR